MMLESRFTDRSLSTSCSGLLLAELMGSSVVEPGASGSQLMLLPQGASAFYPKQILCASRSFGFYLATHQKPSADHGPYLFLYLHTVTHNVHDELMKSVVRLTSLDILMNLLLPNVYV